MSEPKMSLPPGQFQVNGFPRFGTHVRHPPPPVPADPMIEVRGAGAEGINFPVAGLFALPRQELVADFHCVSGWSSLGLRWEGVGFATFYRQVILPATPRGQVSHVSFGGMDGYQSVVLLEDALAGDVLLADHLEGRPLDGVHGAPVRVVSPSQYGFISTKHLCRIELHDSPPPNPSPGAVKAGPFTLPSVLIKPHPRARVWSEERHADLPPWLLRPLYRWVARQILDSDAAGERRTTAEAGPDSDIEPGRDHAGAHDAPPVNVETGRVPVSHQPPPICHTGETVNQDS